MSQLSSLTKNKVFYYFEQLCKIPHGSYNMDAIAEYCVDFATKRNLRYIHDDANNVIIFKNGTANYENSAPIILQGHLDMVCQKTPDCNINFEKDALDLYIDGDFIKARGTTLGADNGIAVAMILAILDSNELSHPPIEAVFTTDEEVGMIGARKLDMSVLNGNRMINLDSETDNIVTVSCAGGSDFVVNVPLETTIKSGEVVTIEICGLKGGHSGVEINKNRVNANMIAGRILNELKDYVAYDIISINGGDKSNAIPNRCVIKLCLEYSQNVCDEIKNITQLIKNEICDKEPDFNVTITQESNCECNVFSQEIKKKIIYTLLCVPNGVTEMSATVDNLVQTSLNLGILITTPENITLHFALRSNKMSALNFLEKRLCAFFDLLSLPCQTFGHYPAWEYCENSAIKDLYCSTYTELFGVTPIVKAIHAGLECGVFAGEIKDFDCISIGPTMHDVHTTSERLSISSTEKTYSLITKILEKLK